jgi:chromosomal replication initiation ATPase DnaA
VLALVSTASGISRDALLGPSRARAVSEARSAALYLLRTDLGLSAPHVGQIIGRSPATVRDLSRLVARGERAGELVARVRVASRPRWKSRGVVSKR